ncbi:cytochrome c biogenesis CcdA family protein [Methanobacterium subterraneum]|jgi:cytochrome c-type biogenesis protein|uniref:Cytochrome c biogenesis protein CcdA n=1 Tax=Methanobacterium subterraneum TaxID=59277 RepID=A0A7K4DP18_9EURY|nr:cytochrome c biogenesis CcdA family protein [Methanobacterium subterraneum]MBW4258149.1 cytochrome c biogenesis CcdA family protein [Methanobacterium sp. YSL]NMO10150.1 cytochrome c biogenesis protein CcdA [Methanobacterium subterraneum]PKL73742.1 MAG: cytochrome c biogenesis protein CcdA [Methanobacteriales archaeon HGW-Methanobacteriales-2]
METGFLISFLAGMASIISPCVLPLIPIVVGFSLLKRKNTEIVAFGLGFFLLFAIITIFTAIFTAAINYYLLYFRIAAALILVIIGVLFIVNKRLFNISAPSISNTSDSQKGIVGSFLMGFLTCLAWSPCFGPYVVAVATYSASTGDITYSIINMALFAAGFSLAILLVAFLVSKIDLQRITRYSKAIGIILGFIIAGAGLYMLIGFL